MSTLKVDTIQDQAGGNASTPDEIYNGRAKAWVNFDGTGTVAIRDDFNVSSITDLNTGNYAVTFSNALSDSNFSATVTSSDDNVSSALSYIQGVYGGSFTPTTSTINVYCTNNAGSPTDRSIVNVAVFR